MYECKAVCLGKVPKKKASSVEDTPSTEEEVRVKLARIYAVPALDFSLSWRHTAPSTPRSFLCLPFLMHQSW